MNVLIVEPQSAAIQRLTELLQPYSPILRIAGVRHSLKDGRRWFEENGPPDLVFLEPELPDGDGFELLRGRKAPIPVIIITGDASRAREAFDLFSIAYQLKPLSKAALTQSMEKYLRIRASYGPSPVASLPAAGTFKSRFLVQSGPDLFPVPVKEVACFFTEQERLFLFTRKGKEYLLTYTLEELEQRLDPQAFFRVNRQTIIHIAAVKKVQPYFNRRLIVLLDPPAPREIIISKERAVSFKAWLDY